MALADAAKERYGDIEIFFSMINEEKVYEYQYDSGVSSGATLGSMAPFFSSR